MKQDGKLDVQKLDVHLIDALLEGRSTVESIAGRTVF